jgi:serine protease Do
LPENIGVRLHVDRGNLVEKVQADSPAAKAGIQPGDKIRQVGNIPVLSFADMQQGLEEAPREGKLSLVYRRDGKDREATLQLAPRWKKTDITWRTSLRGLIPTVPLAGKNLTAEEKASLGLPAKALAFRQRDSITQIATDAGFKPGDIVLGVEGRDLEMDVYGFQDWVRREFLVGDTLKVSLMRDGKRMVLPVVLGRR